MVMFELICLCFSILSRVNRLKCFIIWGDYFCTTLSDLKFHILPLVWYASSSYSFPVYCEVCIAVPEDGNIVCKVCECPQPRGCPNVCLEFNNIIEERFPKEYATRRGSTEQKQSHFQQKNPSSMFFDFLPSLEHTFVQLVIFMVLVRSSFPQHQLT